jgi:hypothetical protein
MRFDPMLMVLRSVAANCLFLPLVVLNLQPLPLVILFPRFAMPPSLGSKEASLHADLRLRKALLLRVGPHEPIMAVTRKVTLPLWLGYSPNKGRL